MSEFSEIRPVYTPRMRAVVTALQRASEALSARQIGEAAGIPDRIWWTTPDAVRKSLRELIDCGWVDRHDSPVRRTRSDPLWVFALTEKGRRLAAADFGAPADAGKPDGGGDRGDR